MRRVGVALVALVAVLAAPARADVENVGDGVKFSGGSHAWQAPGRVTVPVVRPGVVAPTHLVPVLRNVGGVICIGEARRPGAESSLTVHNYELTALRLLAAHPWCDGVAPRAVSPAAAAAIAWERLVRLERPELRIQPGEAIAGKAAFLEIGGSRTGQWRFEEFGFAIDLSATSTYDIDWGDGNTSRGVASNGGPWPNGDVRHVYTRAGSYTVTVVQRWTATYAIDGTGGTVPGALQTESRLIDFPVTEVQAVRNR